MNKIISAFPVNDEFTNIHEQGMTLRDYFAGQAMVGIIAHYGDNGDFVKRAYNIANGMLAEREGGEKPQAPVRLEPGEWS